MNIQAFLTEKVNQAMINSGAHVGYEAQIRQSSKIQFGDYQVNGIITTANKLNIPPRQLAEKILAKLDLNGIARKIEIINPGFINIFLDPVFLSDHVDAALKSDRLGISLPKPQTVVVDYSSPNVAKEMHVGHLRSTIIGDAVVRTLEFLGHRVIRANHIGDWGTQFGMLIAYLEKWQQESTEAIDLSNLEKFYREAKKNFDEDKVFAENARNYVVKLQRGDTYCLSMWRRLVDVTMSQNQTIYNLLNVTLTHSDIMGESMYNSMLPTIVNDLKKQGLAVKNKGAIVVFLDQYKNKLGNPIGVIVQKKDGGYLYTTTDIACANYRYKTLHADRILYYVDSRQHQHLMQAWAITKKAGYVPDTVQLEHHAFGMILGKDGKPFKTRSGKVIRLFDLLKEALIRARRLIIKKNPEISTEKLEKLSNVVGIGAVKYADLSKNRTTDYVFDWDQMLSFEGNTAPYMQYAYARILSIFHKASIDESMLVSAPVIFSDNREVQLAVRLLQFEETLTVVARDGTPHVMCSYLYDLACLFSHFYEHCSILYIKNDRIRNSRLKLAQLTAKTLKLGLNMLGIETVERM